LGKLARSLAAGSRVTVESVHGMGGVGKTQLATEYAYAHASDYDLVWWINAEETAAIPDQFTTLATQLGLDPAADPDGLQVQIHDRLRSVPRWLLIFDNAASVGEIAPWLPSGPRAAPVAGHVMVTTRRGGFAALGQVLDLDVIPLADAVRLLRTRVPKLDQRTGKLIANELGRLPLALEQAAAYLDRSQIPAAEYLQLLRERAADLHRRGRVASRNDTIATLWDLSLERLKAESPAAVQLLAIGGYLAAEPIPLDLFTTHPDLLPKPLSAAVIDPLTVADTITAAVDYSLVKRTAAGLQLHRLVQAALRAHHPAGENPLRGIEPKPEQPPGEAVWPAGGPLAVVLALLRAEAPEQIMGAPKEWPRWAVLLPHVLTATSHIGGSVASPDLAVMDDAAWLLDRAGTYLQVNARLADAKSQVEKALAIDEAGHGPDHPDVAADLNNLALILRDLGQFGEARPLQERALAITEATYGPDHPDVAVCLASLAQTLLRLDQPGQARPLQERALAIHEASYGPGHPYVAIDLNNLGQILQDLGQHEQARLLQERALAIYEASYGPDHPYVASALHNLATILLALEQPGEARPLQERALAITEATYGPDHPTVGTRLNELAMILRDLGQPREARQLQERALAIYEAIYGPEHRYVGTALNNLARILLALGQPGEARPLQERALAIEEATYGPDHPQVARDLDNLGRILQDLGQYEEARPLHARAQAIDEAARSARARPASREQDR
jgi:tetratricopeptide (TPR) repeat protein